MDADQKARIAANKAAALAKLAAKKKRKSDQETTQPKRPRTADDCDTCGALADAAFRTAFSIQTCNACRRRDPSLDLLNATIAAQRRTLEALKATGQPSPGDTLPFGELTAFVGFDEYNAEAERYSTGE